MVLFCGQPLDMLLRMNFDAFLLWDAAGFVDTVGQECRAPCLACSPVYCLFQVERSVQLGGEGM